MFESFDQTVDQGQESALKIVAFLFSKNFKLAQHFVVRSIYDTGPCFGSVEGCVTFRFVRRAPFFPTFLGNFCLVRFDIHTLVNEKHSKSERGRFYSFQDDIVLVSYGVYRSLKHI